MLKNEASLNLIDSDRMPPVFRVQLVRERQGIREEAACPADAAKVISRFLQSPDREHVVVLMLDVKNRVIGLHTVSVGSLEASIVNTREVFKAPILANAASIVVAHNHPSGDLTPSREDIEIGRKLYEAGILMDIDVIDHIIIGEDGDYFSFQQAGIRPYGTPGMRSDGKRKQK